MIKLSDTAKDEVRRLIAQKPTGSFLRVSVKGGGCSGLSYDVKFDHEAKEWDREFQFDDVKLICDSKSLIYLDGMMIDFSTDLVGGGFRFINPNASGTCGCGTSFSV